MSAILDSYMDVIFVISSPINLEKNTHDGILEKLMPAFLDPKMDAIFGISAPKNPTNDTHGEIYTTTRFIEGDCTSVKFADPTQPSGTASLCTALCFLMNTVWRYSLHDFYPSPKNM